MSKKAIASPNDLNPSLEDDFDLLGEDTPLVGSPVQPEKSVDLSDYSDFEAGIVDITPESEACVKALIYGPNGTGKTTIAGTFPEPILVLDINERGTRVLASSSGGKKKRATDTFEMLVQAFWYLKNSNHPYKTVVLDNVTSLQEIAMKYIMDKEASFDLSKDVDMPTRRDWGGLSQIMKRWLIEFRNLPMNVVFIAQEKRDSEDDLESDQASVYPQISPAVRGILGAAVDVIGRTYVNEVTDDKGHTQLKFCMRVAPGPRYLAKIRCPRGAQTPKSIVNPTYEALNKVMSGLYKKGE